MPFAPLRPRRRRNAFDRPAPSVAAPPRSNDLSAIATRIAGLIDGPVTEAIVVMLTELYGDALARIIGEIDKASGGSAILDRLCADRLVGGLLVVHDLHPEPLARRIERALDGLGPAADCAVALARIDDDVVYLTIPAGVGAAQRALIAHTIAEAAPEISAVYADAQCADEFAMPSASR